MPLPKRIEWVTFDVYGCLIDWETGIYEAFEKEAAKDGLTVDREQLLAAFDANQREVKQGPYELYAEVMRRTVIKTVEDLDWPLESARARFLPAALPTWPAFKDANPALKRLHKNFKLGLISNIDDKLLGESRRMVPVDFDLVVTGQQVRSYKPEWAHFKEFERRIGGKKGWVHIGSSYYYDVEPCLQHKIPVIWVNRDKQKLESGQRKPTEEVKNLREAAKLLIPEK